MYYMVYISTIFLYMIKWIVYVFVKFIKKFNAIKLRLKNYFKKSLFQRRFQQNVPGILFCIIVILLLCVVSRAFGCKLVLYD